MAYGPQVEDLVCKQEDQAAHDAMSNLGLSTALKTVLNAVPNAVPNAVRNAALGAARQRLPACTACPSHIRRHWTKCCAVCTALPCREA